MEMVASLVGKGCDPKTSANHMYNIIDLGADIITNFVKESYATRVAKTNAKKWATIMRQNLRGRCNGGR